MTDCCDVERCVLTIIKRIIINYLRFIRLLFFRVDVVCNTKLVICQLLIAYYILVDGSNRIVR